MGSQISSLCRQLQPKRKYVLIVGQENSGKTTFLYGTKLKPGWEQTDFEHTVGYNYEELRTTSGVLAIFDTPGNEALFPIVRNLYKNLMISGVVYVFRLSNKAIDFIMAKRRLKFLANEPELKKCALSIVCNVSGEIDAQFKEKSYLEKALGVDELKHIDNKEVFVFDAKYSPKESDFVWRWMNERVETDD
ncbi:hypothetical protein SteCoe_20154 [Stentor coeruleus]|uniref:Signal recognition particle receptor subunit beta n=1 Tax=Stentor coeruleus TaxID=5963 RepID=A0A1R2BT55_9CILI|nr:hypothetical protein SteCoe_20154 [Stentor coeruleus]